MRPAQKPVGGKFSASLLLCLSDPMGRRKEEEYNTKMVDGYEAPQQKEVRRPVAPRSCGWRPGTLYLGAWPDGSGQARYWARREQRARPNPRWWLVL